MELSPNERHRVLAFVREVIQMELAGADTPEIPEIDRLKEQGACFVTLSETGGQLRGCIGNIESFEPLGENLRRNAVNAAFQDPRFPAVEAEELPELSIEVSILTPIRRIPSILQFRLGIDGIILRADGRSAVFLPQVPGEQGWDKPTTLRYLARKAGLPIDVWQTTRAEFFTFQAEVFNEKNS